MSLLNSASLVVTPNGYKEGTLYSVIPNTTLGDMTVVRATTATRVNNAGLIEVVPYNLMTYSQVFSNAIWTKDNSTVTSGFTSPSGAADAFKLIELATTAVHNIYISFATLSLGVYTTSIYIKKAERFKVAVADRNSGVYVSYNLNTGTIIDSLSLVGTIESLDNDWYRLTATTSSSVSVYVPQFFILQDSYTTGYPINLPYLGNGTSGIYIWGAQFVESSTAKDYLRTETRLNIPRLDYSNGTCPSLLVEPQRTNLLNYSEQFNNAYWELGSVASVTANTTISPDGTQNADTLTANGAGQLFVRNNIYLGTAQTCSNSIFAKKANHRYVGLRNSGTVSAHDVFDFDTKTWTNNSGATLSYDELPNGWFRLKSVNTDAVNLNYYWSVIPAVSTAGAETNTASNLNVYIWGAQAEQNASYPTSYIPTTSAAVTRNADEISKTGISALIGQTEGTLFYDLVFPQNSEASYIGVSNGTTANRIIFGCESNSFFIFGYGSTTLSLNVGTRYKIALAYNATNMLVYVNGVLTNTLTGTLPSGLSRLGFDSGAGSQNLISSVNSVILFPTRLTNAELATLTTL